MVLSPSPSCAGVEPLRILHVFRAPLGGLFRHVLDVARGQIERGHEVGIVCDSTTGGPRADETLERLAPDLRLGLHRVPMRRLPHPTDFMALAKLTQVRREAKPHVLHGHGSKGGLYARLVDGPGGSNALVRAYTPHGGSFNYRPGTLVHRAYMLTEKALRRRTDVFLFESAYILERFETFVGGTDRIVRVVRNGIAESEFEPLVRAAEPFDLLYLGELRDAKGVEVLIDALSAIRRESRRRVSLLVVGSGPNEADLRRRVSELGFDDAVTFEPPQPIRAALSRARIMVVPSKAESLPYVILEAAAAAQPLVSTDVGGIPEIFGPFAHELIPAGDVQALKTAILHKLEQPEPDRRETARALADHVKGQFRIDTMVEEGIEAYRQALGSQIVNRR